MSDLAKNIEHLHRVVHRLNEVDGAIVLLTESHGDEPRPALTEARALVQTVLNNLLMEEVDRRCTTPIPARTVLQGITLWMGFGNAKGIALRVFVVVAFVICSFGIARCFVAGAERSQQLSTPGVEKHGERSPGNNGRK